MHAAGVPGLGVARPFSVTTSTRVDHHITIGGGHSCFGVVVTSMGPFPCEAEGRELNTRPKFREA
jgi:hypothetical protein